MFTVFTIMITYIINVTRKLQLSCYKWTQLADGDNPDVAIALLTRRVKEDLLSLRRTDSVVQASIYTKYL